EFANGTYFLKSATLINNGKVSELTCTGEFFIVLQKDTDSVRVQPVGSASCPAANPGSFVEVLGGDCDQAVAVLTRSSDATHYTQSGADWSCASRSSAQLEIALSAVKEKSLRVLRRNLQEPSLVTEFVFIRSADVL
ncbi:MAG: hypothetical protein RJB13_2372, partial [Pseudomonadota bacterium]